MSSKFNLLYFELLERFNEQLEKIPLVEMSSNRSMYINKIEDLSLIILVHIYKLILKPTGENNIDHWRREINNWLEQINSILRRMIKRLSADEIYKCLIVNSDVLNDAKRKYKKLYPTSDQEINEQDDYLKSIIDKISFELSYPNNLDKVEEIINNL